MIHLATIISGKKIWIEKQKEDNPYNANSANICTILSRANFSRHFFSSFSARECESSGPVYSSAFINCAHAVKYEQAGLIQGSKHGDSPAQAGWQAKRFTIPQWHYRGRCRAERKKKKKKESGTSIVRLLVLELDIEYPAGIALIIAFIAIVFNYPSLFPRLSLLML